mgnify:CR=1 FL=1
MVKKHEYSLIKRICIEIRTKIRYQTLQESIENLK